MLNYRNLSTSFYSLSSSWCWLTSFVPGVWVNVPSGLCVRQETFVRVPDSRFHRRRRSSFQDLWGVARRLTIFVPPMTRITQKTCDDVNWLLSPRGGIVSFFHRVSLQTRSLQTAVVAHRLHCLSATFLETPDPTAGWHQHCASYENTRTGIYCVRDISNCWSCFHSYCWLFSGEHQLPVTTLLQTNERMKTCWARRNSNGHKK